ncbi:MAG: hypothetical protein QOF01_471 [Thermomicrobiales bacterium]|nr:hypothetical protein [Thermomicrobiales bacterium]
MFPYSAADVLRVMRDEFKPDDERHYGARVARDYDPEDDRPDDSDPPNDQSGFSLRLLFLRRRMHPQGA